MESSILNRKTTNVLYLVTVIITGLALFGYTSYRAAHLSFTHDESLSFNLYIFSNASFVDIITMKLPTANNHILNTLLMDLCYHIFGPSELSLRYPNLLAHIIYMIFTALWLWKFENKLLFAAGFIILNCNPYLLEFFSLARGYGLAIGFMTISIYCFFRYASKSKISFAIWSLLAGIFAIMSNFALIYFMLGLYCAFNLVFLFDIANKKQNMISKFRGWFKMNIPLIASVILAFPLMYAPVSKLLASGQLFVGGSTFWGDTVNSLIMYELYSHVWNNTLQTIKILIIVFAFIGFALTTFGLFNEKLSSKTKSLIYALCLLSIPCLIAAILHYFAGTHFLMTRFALFLVPLFLMYLISLFDFISGYRAGLYPAVMCVCMIAGFFVYHFYLNHNTVKTEEWDYDASEREAITAIKNDYVIHFHNRQKISIGIFWMAEPALNYYREVKHYDWLEELNRDGVGGIHDYYYLMKDNIRDLPNIKLRLMAYYPTSGFYLFAKE